MNNINQNVRILPHHRICMRSAVHSDISKSVSLTYKRLVTKDTALVIDAVWGELAQILHGILVPFSISVLRFAEYQSITPSTIISQKERVLLNEAPESDFGIDNDTVKYLFNHLLFSVGPNPNRLIPFMDGLADQMGWTVVGLVIQGSENDTSFELYGRKAR